MSIIKFLGISSLSLDLLSHKENTSTRISPEVIIIQKKDEFI
jgi:hypothetical protein